jgi:Zn-dependent M28 family amino/carboxypeptidase
MWWGGGKLVVLIFLLIMLIPVVFIFRMISMPGKSYSGPLPALLSDESDLETRLKGHVSFLAGEIGERNVVAYEALQATAQYIEDFLKAQGYSVKSQEYVTQRRKVRNLIAEIPGASRANEIVVIGAHYDTVDDCPGADDNSSGVAGLLELARRLKGARPSRTLRFVAFVNEEPPWFGTENMGSWVYARQARKLNENIVAAISLETIGMYSDTEASQKYPAGLGMFYPSKGNFIGFVGNLASRPLLREAVKSFRARSSFPSEGAAAPQDIPGMGWSDHWSFWQEGYPAIMVTDTAPFRNKNYHRSTDTPDTLDYQRMARVVHGLERVVLDLGK